ncbi:hypothetical protein [Ottowia sp.]|uniref:hypothetical protein n=1 Tax=Ottowia sp. TaxID=1898956 RepID=UPI00394FDE99
MRTTTLLATIAVLGAALGAPAWAGDHHHKRERQPQASAPAQTGYDHGMQVVAHSAGPGQPGHGWQYFSDPNAQRAVVISPQGDYYLSQGRGLRWVAAAQQQA